MNWAFIILGGVILLVGATGIIVGVRWDYLIHMPVSPEQAEKNRIRFEKHRCD